MREGTGLSARQLEALMLLAEGLRHQEIADRMFIEKCTAERYIEEVRRKLGARNSTHAVGIGYRTGVLK